MEFKIFNKNYYLLIASKLISNLGDALYNISISWYILDITKSTASMSIYLALGTATYIITGFFMGCIVDKFNKVKLLYVTDFIRGIVIMTTGIAIILNVKTYFILLFLYITAVILNINSAIFSPATTAVLKNIIEEEKLTKANAYMVTVGTVASIFGLLYGSIIYYRIGIQLVFVLNSLSFIISGFLGMFIKFNENVETLRNQKYIELLSDGVKYVKKQKLLMFIVFFAAIWNFIYTPIYSVYLPLTFKNVIKDKIVFLAIVQSALSFGLLMGSILVSHINNNKIYSLVARVVSLQLLIFISFPLIIGLWSKNLISVNNLVLAFVCDFFILGVLICIVNVNISVMIQKMVNESYIGRVSALHSTLCMCAMPVSLILGGIIAQYASIFVTYSIQAMLFIFLTIFVWFIVWKSKEVPFLQ